MKAAYDAKFQAELEKSERIRAEIDASMKATEVNNERHKLTLSWKRQGFEVRELQAGESFEGTYQGQANIGEKKVDVMTAGKGVYLVEQASKREQVCVIDKDRVVTEVRPLSSSLEKGDRVAFGQRSGQKPEIQRQADPAQKRTLERQLSRSRGRGGPGFR